MMMKPSLTNKFNLTNN